MSQDQEGTKARKAYKKLIDGDMKKIDFDQQFKSAFNQRIIAVPNYLKSIEHLNNLTEDILWITTEEHERFYNSDTGLI